MIIFFGAYYFLQMWFLLITTMLALVFITHAKPYKDRVSNFLEFAGESANLVSVYIATGFSIVGNEARKTQVGWWYISVIMIVFATEIAFVLYRFAKLFVVKVRTIAKSRTAQKIMRTLRRKLCNKAEP